MCVKVSNGKHIMLHLRELQSITKFAFRNPVEDPRTTSTRLFCKGLWRWHIYELSDKEQKLSKSEPQAHGSNS